MSESAVRAPIEQLMTAEEVGRRLRCDSSTVHRLARSGALGWVPVGRKRLFAEHHIAKYVAEHEHAAQPVQRPARRSR